MAAFPFDMYRYTGNGGIKNVLYDLQEYGLACSQYDPYIWARFTTPDDPYTFMVHGNLSAYNPFCYTYIGGEATGGVIAPYPTSAGGMNTISSTEMPVVLYVELGKVSDLISSGYNVVERLYDNATENGVSAPADGMENWLYIKSIKWYDNSENGEYSQIYTRKVISEGSGNYYDLAYPVHVSQIFKYSNGGTSSSSSDINVDFAVSFRGCFYNQPEYGALKDTPTTSYSRFSPLFARSTANIDYTGKYGRSLFYYTRYDDGFFFTAIENTAKFDEFARMWGVPVFYNLRSVQTENSKSPGQPDNPDPTDTPIGTGDNSSDGVVIPTVTTPPVGGYNMLWINRENLSNMWQYLFSETFINDIRRLWSDPSDSIIALIWYPFQPLRIFQEQISAGTAHMNIANFSNIDSIIGYPHLVGSTSTPYIDMGYLDIEPYFGRYLDYSGYTDITIYMPYVGEYTLDINEVMGKRLKLLYYPDFVSNTFLAILYADNQPIATYTGSMGVNIAISGTNYNQFLSNISSSLLNTVKNVGSSAAAGNLAGAAGALTSGIVETGTTQMETKQVGSISSSTAIYAPQIPYVRISRPYISRPAAWDTLRGVPAGYSTLVSECTGYLEVDEIRLVSNAAMTDSEQAEIETLLKGGIYI